MRHPGGLGQGLWGSEGEMIRNTQRERLTKTRYDIGKHDGTRWHLFLSFVTFFKTSQLHFDSTTHEVLVKISFVRENYASY